MAHRIGLAVLLAVLAGSCEPSRWTATSEAAPHNSERVRSASLFTDRYAKSRFSGWSLHASAAGTDCAALLVETPIVMEDSMVEAMHYGAGAYDVYRGGVQQFCRDRAFRGVAYKDGSGRVWTYGAVTQSEAEGFTPCH